MPGFAGLSLLDTVRQSAAIHSHWSAKEHMAYLIDEAGFTEGEVIAEHEAIALMVMEIRASS